MLFVLDLFGEPFVASVGWFCYRFGGDENVNGFGCWSGSGNRRNNDGGSGGSSGSDGSGIADANSSSFGTGRSSGHLLVNLLVDLLLL